MTTDPHREWSERARWHLIYSVDVKSRDGQVFSKVPDRLRVLVADDDVVMSALMAAALEGAGFDVAVVSDGQQAINEARTGVFDVMVIDVLMPSTNGLQATHALRSAPNRVLLPIVMVSGTDDARLRAQAADLGADDFITKPFSPSELVTRVCAVLRSRSVDANRALWPPPTVQAAHAIHASRHYPWPPPVVLGNEPSPSADQPVSR